MTGTLGLGLTTATAVLGGLAGGVYISFATMVMPSLRRRLAGEAVGTMRRINEMAVGAPFMIIFFGGAAGAAAVIVTQFASDAAAAVPARTFGAGLVLASFMVTLLFNVPRNNRLARATATSPAQVWQAFDHGWSRSNHVRGALAIVGAITLTASLTH